MGKLCTSQLPFLPNSSINASININNILCDSLLIEIFQRLPCISVLRAKSVCRHWCLLLSNPCFIQTFLHYHDQHSSPFTIVYEFHFWHRYLTNNLHRDLHIVSDHKKFKSKEFHLGFLPYFRPWESHPISVVASHKDLLVCCDPKMSSVQGVYYICNPLTKKWLALPPSLAPHRIADTATAFILTGNSFKLLQVPKLDSHSSYGNQFEVKMLSSEVGEWRKYEVTSPRSFERTWQFKPNAKTFKNKFHWLVNSSNIVVIDPLELVRGSCRIIDLPTELKPDMGICLGSCQNCLTVCQITGGCVLLVWKLRGYDTGDWELECKISLREMVFLENLYNCNLRFSAVEVLAFHPNDFESLYLRFDNQIVICNVRRRVLEVVSECLLDSRLSVGTCGVFLLMHPCWPSLIPSLPLT